ncbi:MAG TPA: DUF6279 family lipoprotein [Burkholderiaceae bacterium]|nr:DUF6279 family lipoprotein [Burkholderiaceae bacterium]HQR75037.1 DUF6279 family lipoprotein [Burkholderiaceae bacterium]
MRSDSKSPLVRLRRWLLLAALLLAGCSAGVRLGYNNADTLLVYTIDGYIGLSPEQEQLVKERTGTLIAWHRATQLRDYAQLVEATRRRLEGPVTAADVLAFSSAINARLAAVGERAAPDLAQLALTLTPDQVARMQRKLASDNAKARRELAQLASKETLDDRVRRYAERADFWFGSLTREQLALVRDSLAKRPDSSGWWLDERERRQRELIGVVQRIQAERPTEDVAAGWVRAYFAQLQLPTDAERRARVTEFRAVNAELVAQLVNAATAEQKSKLSRRLASFAEDFAALATERIAPLPG